MRPPGASSIVYIALVAAAALAAILERRRALRHETRLRRDGGEEVAPWIYRLMVPVYTLVFPAAIAEHALLRRSPPPWFAVAMALLFLLAFGTHTLHVALLDCGVGHPHDGVRHVIGFTLIRVVGGTHRQLGLCARSCQRLADLYPRFRRERPDLG